MGVLAAFVSNYGTGDAKETAVHLPFIRSLLSSPRGLRENKAMKTKFILAAALLTSTLTVPAIAEDAPAAASKPYVCLRHNDVDGWGARDNHSMVVNDRFGRKYLVTLNGLCSDLNWAFGAGFKGPGRMGAVGSCVDRGDRVVMGGGGVSPVTNNTCWVSKVQLYTKDMQAADKLARETKQPLAAY
jgi:hypothetical protein